jgi:DNA polymerase III subunit delta'
LNTILSRTQIVKIRSIENNALRDALIERHDALSDNATNTASLASGDYIEAVKLLADEASSSAMMFIEWMQMCVQPNLTSNSVAMTQLIGWLEQFSKAGRENQKNVIRYGLHISERLFGYQINGNLDGLNETEQQFVKNFSGKITLNNIDSYYHQLNNCHFYLERNANIKLLMMTMSLRMSRLFIGEVVADALVLS